MQLSNEAVIQQVITPTAGVAGTTDINGSVVDMANFRGVLHILTMGAITVNAVTSAKLQQGAAANLSDAADLTGTAVTIADDDDDGVFYLDLFEPEERYVRIVVDRGTANAVVTSCVALKYGPRVKPVTQTLTGELSISPVEGTA